MLSDSGNPELAKGILFASLAAHQRHKSCWGTYHLSAGHMQRLLICDNNDVTNKTVSLKWPVPDHDTNDTREM